MKEVHSIRKWKLPIIRWAMRQVAPCLPALKSQTFEKLAKFGIEDLYTNPITGDVALYPSAEPYEPEL